jgi:curved DNA-binding protein CbpA
MSRAYSILSDESKRIRYDKYGIIDEDNFNFKDFMNNFTFNFNDFFDIDMEDFLEINFPSHHLKYIIRKGKDIKNLFMKKKIKKNNIKIIYLIYYLVKKKDIINNEDEEEEEEKNNFINDESEEEEIKEVDIDLQNFLDFIDEKKKKFVNFVKITLMK